MWHNQLKLGASRSTAQHARYESKQSAWGARHVIEGRGRYRNEYPGNVTTYDKISRQQQWLEEHSHHIV